MAVNSAGSFSFNSVNYWGDSYHVLVRTQGLVVPDIPAERVHRQPLSGADGDVTQGSTYEALEIVLPCVCHAGDGTLETKLAAIRTALIAADGQERTLVLKWLPAAGDTFQARRIGPVKFDRKANGAYFELRFLASEPSRS